MINILLIEDDLIDQMAFERMVRKKSLNYNYEITAYISEAKKLLKEKEYDAIILDMNLKDGTAFELLEDIKTTPIIFSTGGGDEEIAVKALRAGAFDYLIKDENRNYLTMLPLIIERAIQAKNNEAELLLMKEIIKNTDHAILVVDTKDLENQKITFANTAFLEMTGYSMKEIIGKSPKMFQGEATSRKKLDAIRAGLESATLHKTELINYNKEGNPYWIEISIFPIPSKEKPSTFVAIQRDISTRKKNDEELKVAKQAAENAQAAEKAFLANMSHEIRTPMNAVIGMSQLLLDSNPTDTQKDYLKSLLFSADNLMAIINDILDFSKIESGELTLENLEFDLFNLLHAVQDTMRFRLKDKPQILLTFDLDLHLENKLIGDPTRLTQILINLINNAIKFTNEGEIKVKVELNKKINNIYWIDFQIADTGIGIKTEKIHEIFNKFKQASEDITRRYGGTGLGLAIVKEIVELKGGSISVESHVGAGTTFNLSLPYQNSINKISFEEQLEITPSEQLDLSGTRILVVEDNPMNQKLIRLILEQWRCEYIIVNDGEEGIENTQRFNFDIILMDVQMPGIDGYETTRLIRSDQENPNQKTPIIALTAAALVEEKRKALAAGMNTFVSKPYTPNKLKKIIANLIDIAPSLAPTFKHEDKKDIQFNYLKNTFGADSNFIIEMIDLFLKENPNDLKKLTEAAKNQDWNTVHKTAHKIKSGFLMMDLEDCEAIALSIETKAKNLSPEERPLLEKLVSNLSELLHDYYDKLDAAKDTIT